MEKLSGLREDQRNPPRWGQQHKHGSQVAEGLKMNHSYQTCRRQKREKTGLCHHAGLVCSPEHHPLGGSGQVAQTRTLSPWGVEPGWLNVCGDVSSMGRARSALPAHSPVGTEAAPVHFNTSAYVSIAGHPAW